MESDGENGGKIRLKRKKNPQKTKNKKKKIEFMGEWNWKGN